MRELFDCGRLVKLDLPRGMPKLLQIKNASHD